jgi:hypothetical protein
MVLRLAGLGRCSDVFFKLELGRSGCGMAVFGIFASLHAYPEQENGTDYSLLSQYDRRGGFNVEAAVY